MAKMNTNSSQSDLVECDEKCLNGRKCKATFPSESLMRAHQKKDENHRQYQYRCKVKGCMEKFDRIARVKMHLKDKHSLGVLSGKETIKPRTPISKAKAKATRNPKVARTPTARSGARKINKKRKLRIQGSLLALDNQASQSATDAVMGHAFPVNDKYIGPTLKNIEDFFEGSLSGEVGISQANPQADRSLGQSELRKTGIDAFGCERNELLEEVTGTRCEHVAPVDAVFGFIDYSPTHDTSSCATDPRPLQQALSAVRRVKPLSLLERRNAASTFIGNPYYENQQEQLRELAKLIPQFQPERILRMYKIGARALRVSAVARDPGRDELFETERYLYWPKPDGEPIVSYSPDDPASLPEDFNLEALRRLAAGPIVRHYSRNGWMGDDSVWHPGQLQV